MTTAAANATPPDDHLPYPETFRELAERLIEASRKHPKNRASAELRSNGLTKGILMQMAGLLTHYADRIKIDEKTQVVIFGAGDIPPAAPDPLADLHAAQAAVATMMPDAASALPTETTMVGCGPTDQDYPVVPSAPVQFVPVIHGPAPVTDPFDIGGPGQSPPMIGG